VASSLKVFNLTAAISESGKYWKVLSILKNRGNIFERTLDAKIARIGTYGRRITSADVYEVYTRGVTRLLIFSRIDYRFSNCTRRRQPSLHDAMPSRFSRTPIVISRWTDDDAYIMQFIP